MQLYFPINSLMLRTRQTQNRWNFWNISTGSQVISERRIFIFNCILTLSLWRKKISWEFAVHGWKLCLGFRDTSSIIFCNIFLCCRVIKRYKRYIKVYHRHTGSTMPAKEKLFTVKFFCFICKYRIKCGKQ